MGGVANMILAVDIGNTKIALGIFKNGELEERWRIAADLRRTSEEYAVILDGLFRLQDSMEHRDLKGAILASVVPNLDHVFMQSIHRLCPEIPITILDSSYELGMKNLYENPWEVGADRIANAVGGRERFGYPLIIVDFGTATNIDVLNDEGDYIGGVILPGIEMTADALFQRTAKLPRISITLPDTVIGKTTVHSMQSGIGYGIIASVDALVERIWDELGYTTRVLGTGGAAEMFTKVSKTIDSVDSYLTLYGLKYIWERNLER